MTIRPATFSDCETIHQFLCDLEEEILDPIRFRAIFRHNLQEPRFRYFVIEADTGLVGYVSCHVQHLLHHVGLVGEIQELYIAPAYRNQRLGRQLIAYLEALATKEGWINLEVTTNQKRTDTQRFYEQLGFQATHMKFVKSLQ